MLRYEEKDPGLILKLPTLKLIIDHAEANKDGEPHYQVVKLNFFFCEKYIVNYVMEIVHGGMFQ